MHDSLGEQIIEKTIVAALARGPVDLEQGLGFSAADRLVVFARRSGSRAPGCVSGIERAGKVNAACSGRPLGDHAIAHEGKCVSGHIAVCGEACFDFRIRSESGALEMIWADVMLLFSCCVLQHFHADVNEALRKRFGDRFFSLWLRIGRTDRPEGSSMTVGTGGRTAHQSQIRGIAKKCVSARRR